MGKNLSSIVAAGIAGLTLCASSDLEAQDTNMTATVPVGYSLLSMGYLYPGAEGAVVYYVDKDMVGGGSGGAGGGRGFNVGIFDTNANALVESRSFDTWNDRLTGDAHRECINYLNSIPDGRLVMVGVCDEAGLTDWGENRCTKLPGEWVTNLIDTLKNKGSTQIDNYCYNDSWGMIYLSGGATNVLAEGLAEHQTYPAIGLVTIHTYLNKEVPRPSVSLRPYEFQGFNLLSVDITNCTPKRDVEIQYKGIIDEDWQHLITINDSTSNHISHSVWNYLDYDQKYFRVRMDGSLHLPSGF